MTQVRATAEWRLFLYNWVAVGAMAGALALAVAVTRFSITLETAVVPFAAAGACAVAGHWFAVARPSSQGAAFAFGSVAQIVLITLLAAPLTYVAAAADLPMQDANLAALDRMLGLDWHAYFNFIYPHPKFIALVVIGYFMIGWPLLGIPVALSIGGCHRRLQQFTLAYVLALAITTAISALVPAFGVYDQLGIKYDPSVFTPGAYLDQLRDLSLLRDGSLRALDIMKLVGIVTFPSFHAAAAVLYLWTLWGVWWMRPVALIANIGMLLAAPMGGGHYFVDILAGAAVAILSIAAARWIGARLTRTAEQPAGALAAPEVAISTR